MIGMGAMFNQPFFNGTMGNQTWDPIPRAPFQHLAWVSGVFIHRDGLGMREHGEIRNTQTPNCQHSPAAQLALAPFRGSVPCNADLPFERRNGTRPRIKHWININGLVEGKIYRKTQYLIGKSMVSCRFSLKPIH